MDLNQSADERQTDAPATAVGAVAALGLVETFKYILLLVFDNADTGIGYLHLQEQVGRIRRLCNLGMDGDGAAVTCELDGVRHEVVQYMLDIRGREPTVFAVVDAVHGEV